MSLTPESQGWLQVRDMERTLDLLDYEDDDNTRALLIDHAIELSDLNPECAVMWAQYR